MTQGEEFVIIIRDTTDRHYQKNINKYLIRRLKKVNWFLSGSTVDFCGMVEKNKKLRQKKQKKNGGSGSQYQENQQKAFPPGTVLVPQYQKNKV